MMDKIYTEAECVVVWLGEAQATDTLALELLKEIHAPWATSDDIPILENGKGALSHDAILAQRMPQPYFDALAAFLLRPWFSRIWMYVSRDLLGTRAWPRGHVNISQCSGVFARTQGDDLVWNEYDWGRLSGSCSNRAVAANDKLYTPNTTCREIV